MTTSMNMGKGSKTSRPPLWRRKANYVLRELVRAGYGKPYDTSVMWGLSYAFSDILHTFAKENDLPIPRLFFWFELFWEVFAKYLGEQVFKAADRRKVLDILVLGFPSQKTDLCKKLFYDEALYGIMHLSSVLFLHEKSGRPLRLYFSRAKWPLRYYESLEVAPLDCFAIECVKRVRKENTKA